MCPSIPTHIHPYMSKLRLLLETDDEIMGYIYNGSLRTQDHDPGCSGADPEPTARQTGGGSYCMPIQECNRK